MKNLLWSANVYVQFGTQLSLVFFFLFSSLAVNYNVFSSKTDEIIDKCKHKSAYGNMTHRMSLVTLFSPSSVAVILVYPCITWETKELLLLKAFFLFSLFLMDLHMTYYCIPITSVWQNQFHGKRIWRNHLAYLDSILRIMVKTIQFPATENRLKQITHEKLRIIFKRYRCHFVCIVVTYSIYNVNVVHLKIFHSWLTQ